jgi:FkbH-like protein
MDVDSLANSLGKHHFLDDIIYMYTHGAPISPYWSDEDNWPAWTAPERGRIEPVPPIYVTYPDKADDFYEAVYRQMEMSYRIVRQIDQVKLVIFDLDNTMWRGQMAEHYAPGQSHPHSRNWPLGIWETIHHLRWRGILVAICSKNDLATVESRWNSAIDLPWLKLSDFISVKINWKTKVENISDILEETKLTPKSVVFVDDSPVERGSVTAAFPDIRTIGSDPFQTRRILLWSPETQVAKLTRESQNREEMVRQQIVREGERRSMSRQEFLAALECRVHIVDIRSSGQAEFARFMELINKTNQFNTTGKRWTAAETLQFLNGGGRIMVFFVQDKYAEYGLVGAVLVQGTRVVQFVMSCRVLGMEIESAVLSHVVRLIRDASAEPTSVSGRLVHTDSNGPCRQLFSNAGFAADPTDGEGYVLGPELPLAEAGHVSVSTDFQLQSHAADRLMGHVDQIDNNRISGWAANTNVPDVPVDVSLYVNEFRAVTVTCGRVRSDAVAAGYPGARQFFIDPKPHLKPGVNFLRVCFGSSGEALVRGLREITN